MPADPARVKELFVAALDLPDADTRRALLDRECVGDAELRQRLEALLVAHDNPDSVVQRPLALTPEAGPGTVAYLPATEAVGDVVAGRYKLLQQIGEGGMGVVYMAEQETPVRRRVALKIIKPGMDSRQVVARFEAERQALAMMDHQNIARVHDAGTTASGRPFFVMELVHGVPITDYCDANRLTPQQRLQLFLPVCHAIQHAHQKGIIHRDIKPSNILVTMYDDRPVPKVIDFGVAKAIEQRLTEKTLFTQFGALVGTFEYMSPEQAEMNAFGVDTRSDIYSLGVVLYELLTGTTPLERPRLREVAFDEIRRLIKEEEPPRPSVRLSTSGIRARVAAARHTDPARLSRLMRGELDWLVMRCLEKDRVRRYETANALAHDVERYLNDEPVQACPPSAGYRLRKFTRRNKGPVLAASVVLFALLAGIIGTTWGLIAARESARRERRAKESAEKRLGQVETNNDILSSIFTDLDPNSEVMGGKPLRALLAEHVDRAAAALDAEAIGDPLTVANLQVKLGRAMHGLGELRKAIPLLEKAVATRSAELGEKHRETLDAAYHLGLVYRTVGQLDRAIPLLERAVKSAEAELGDNDVDTLKLRSQLALSYGSDGRYQVAISLHQRVLLARERQLGDTHLETLLSRNDLALAYADAGEIRRPIELLDQSLRALERTKGAEYAETLWVRKNLADANRNAGDYDRAFALHSQTLQACEARLGEEHPQTLIARNGLGAGYTAIGQFERAIPLLERTLRIQESKLGEDHPQSLITRTNLAVAYAHAGKHQLVMETQQRALVIEEAKLGPEHPETLTARANMATAHYESGNLDAAIPMMERTVRQRESLSGADHPRTLGARGNLAAMYAAAGRQKEAFEINEQNLKRYEATLGNDHPDTLQCRNNLGEAYQDAGKPEEALKQHELAFKGRKAKLGEDHPDTLESMHNLAIALRRTGQNDRSEALHKETVDRARKKLGPNHPDLVVFLKGLADARKALGRGAEALPLFDEAYRIGVSQLGRDHPRTLVAINDLAGEYFAAGRAAEAVPLLKESLAGLTAKLSKNHPHTVTVKGNLAAALLKAGQIEAALSHLEEFVTDMRKIAGPETPGFAGMLATIATDLLKHKQYAVAEKYLRESLAIRQNKAADVWSTFNTKSMLGESLAGQKKYDEADKLLKDGYEGLKQREEKIPPPVRKDRLIEAVERLVKLYEQSEKPADAAKWRAELEARKKQK